MASRNRSHIVVPRPATAESYQRPRRQIDSPPLTAPDDRSEHGTQLIANLRAVETEGLARRSQRSVMLADAIDGIYVVFESFPGVEHALESLEPQQGKLHPELRAVSAVEENGDVIKYATVFIPDGTLGRFLKKIQQYVETAHEVQGKHRNLIDRIRSIGLASLKELWTDSPEDLPSSDVMTWWEVWLRRRDGHEVERLSVLAQSAGFKLGRQSLGFADRTVVLVQATAEQFATALDVLDDLAELRRPREPAALLALEPPADQAEWVDQLTDRTRPATPNSPAVCILDTGVHQQHPLVSGSLAATDCHACDPSWGVTDHGGHGTEMAGLALYGDVGQAIVSDNDVPLRHRLESVKILPPPPITNPPELYGAITATAASLVEIEAPQRHRAFCLAVTARWQQRIENTTPEHIFGEPTSWSAAIDGLAAGLSIDITGDGDMVFLDEDEEAPRRLFVISAGNVPPDGWDTDHLSRSDLEPIEDPGQAWNALTVGAYTKLDDMHDVDQGFAGWVPLARRGELSPHSRTSVAFQRGWPVKPDVVVEGGNVACSPGGTSFDTPEILQLLTIKAPLHDQRLLTVTCATSAATAQTANIAATILADYPGLWPESVRALVAHSAKWTSTMQERFDGAHTRNSRVALHRRYGMGVPDLERATRSATDALTLIAQDVIRPFDGQGRMREMHLHTLPWPTSVLRDLGEAEVRLRVTLSYFVEPNPGRRGWVRRYSYPSHQLRFEVRRPTESTDEFRKRINQKARAEQERRASDDSDASEWCFGPEQRVVGSLHTDIWTGAAAELAERSIIAIYPVTGWWKLRTKRDHSKRGARYALVVSIEAPEQDVDLWTPVAQQVGIPTEIEI